MTVRSDKETPLRGLAAERILVLDGAMGTMIQALGLDERGYRGARFDAWNREVRGNNDLLNLSRPDSVRAIHLAYFRRGRGPFSTKYLQPPAPRRAHFGRGASGVQRNPQRRPPRAQGRASRARR